MFEQFLNTYNGKFVDFDGAYGNQLFDMWYNICMKVFTITSKTHGRFNILLDDIDYKLVSSMGKWNIHKARDKFYAQKRLPSGLVELHRFLTGAKKGEYIDHIDGNTLNNTRANLRICSNADNLRNGRIRPNNTSGYTGVVFDKRDNLWEAKIRVNYKTISISGFDNFEDALGARIGLQYLFWRGNNV